MKVLIVKNISREGPGLIAKVLDTHKIAYDIADLDNGDKFPSPKGYAALIVLGGPESANDKTPKMQDEIKKIREATIAGIPFLGICLGMQALVKAMGGQVIENPTKEIGWRDPKGKFFQVDLTSEGKADPLFKGMRDSVKVFQLHGETVKPAKDMVLLATGQHCRQQVVKFGDNAYGIQGHFELTSDMLDDWRAVDSDLMDLEQAQLLGDHARMEGEYERTARALFENFFRIAKIIK